MNHLKIENKIKINVDTETPAAVRCEKIIHLS